MSAVSVPHPFSEDAQLIDSDRVPTTTQPILALKELVARLHQEQYKVQNLLTSLGFALRSFNNLNQFLEIIPLIAARVADADGSILLQINPEGKINLEHLYCQEGKTCQDFRHAVEMAILEVQSQENQPEKKKPDWQNKPIPPRLNRKLNKSLTPGQSLTEHLDQQVKQSLGKETQLLGTPILVKGVERGRLYVMMHNLNYEWTPTQSKLVQLVADQTAVAIANNELTVELRKKERLDRELEIASEIQLHLLPRKCPQIKGLEVAADCRTASRVGGDYYDFIRADYDRRKTDHSCDLEVEQVPWSIVIGDVMGKGVPAGLIMTMTRGMLRAEVLNRHSPARILEHLNRVMYADLENSHRFVTLFYSEYDPETHILSFSNAAHNPPLWWQAKTKKIQRLDAMGMLIGLEADSNYEDNQVQLSPGDRVIYYTDGFTDAVNSNGERFEEENLIRAFNCACHQSQKPQEVVDYLFDEVQQFIGKGNLNSDDMTLVVLQVQSSD